MKCALSQAKEQKILALQKQNHFLEKQLDQLLRNTEELTSGLKSSNLLTKSLQAQIQVQQMRQSLMKTSIQSLQLQKNSADNSLAQITEQLKELQHENQILNMKLHETSKEKEEVNSMLDRLRKQLKMYQTIGNSQSNIVKASNNLKKNHECLERTLKILKDKLESHKRYLAILQKKQFKEEQQKQKEEKNRKRITTAPKSCTNIHNIMKNEKINCQLSKPQSKQLERKKVKDFDALTRRKNQLLMRAKQ